MADQRQPWEQRDGEGDAAYAAFTRYRDLGPERASVANAAAEWVRDHVDDSDDSAEKQRLYVVREGVKPKRKRPLTDKQVKRRISTATDRFARWSSRWDWVERARAWWNELDRQKREAAAEEVVSTARQHAQILALHVNVLSRPAAELARRIREGELPMESVKPEALWALFGMATRSLVPVMQEQRDVLGLAKGMSSMSAPVGGAAPGHQHAGLFDDAAEVAQAYGGLAEAFASMRPELPEGDVVEAGGD